MRERCGGGHSTIQPAAASRRLAGGGRESEQTYNNQPGLLLVTPDADGDGEQRAKRVDGTTGAR